MPALAALLLLLASARSAHAFDSIDDERAWAVTGVTVVDVRSGGLRRDQTIVVQRGVIAAVGPPERVQPPDGAIVVDEPGRFVIPGLWDMHVHLRGGPALEAANERWLRQYLGFGITAVRDAGGDLPDAVLRWKRQVAQGTIFGPRLYTSLQKIDGADGAWEGSIPVVAAAEVAPALERLQAAGADFVKVYDGSITPAIYLAVLREAERRGLRTAAHVPLSVPFEDAVRAGLDSVEHAFHLLKAANPADRAISQRFARDGIPEDFEPYFVTVTALGDGLDERHARRVFREMAARHTALTPTLYIREAWDRVGPDGPAPGDDARESAVPDAIRDTFVPGLDVFEARTPEEVESDARLERLSLRLTKLAAEQGVTILAGSDTGAENPLVYPGDSLHHELVALVEAGLTPLAALRSATLEPARWFGITQQFGTIETGKAADFVILTANPLEHIENTRKIAAVVQQGVFFDEAKLADLVRLASP